MKLEKLAFSAILITLISLNLVVALHTPFISINPVQWAANTEQDVYLTITNEGADGINRVELAVPETTENVPEYMILETSEPSGWESETRTKTGQQHPYKIIWSTTGSGVGGGSSQDFGFRVTSPSEIGEYRWTVTTTDLKDSKLESHLKTSTSLAPLGAFEITGEPGETQAGKSFKITVKAYDTDGNIKSDYTGVVDFGSTDERAALPASYKFKESDGGIKSFNVVLKTVGDKVVLVSDENSLVSKISDVIRVKAGEIVSIGVLPVDYTVQRGVKVEYRAIGSDVYDNIVDVTEGTSWSIDSLAGGKWEQNVYTTNREGIWTVIGSYMGAKDGTSLTVQKEIVITVPEEPEVVPEEEEPTEEEEPVITPAPTVELSISAEDIVSVEAGGNGTMVLEVENIGNTDLSGVSLSYIGAPEDWGVVYPESEDIDAGESKEFLVEIKVPENISETKTLTFTATSNEGASATKEVTLYAGTAPTGIFVGISKNLLQIAVVIIAIATVVIIVWELWFRK